MDGHFKFRRVASGGWMIRPVIEFDDGFLRSRVEVGEAFEFPSNCAVQSGRETLQDVRLRDRHATFVRGTYFVTGASAGDLSVAVRGPVNGARIRNPFEDEWEERTPIESGEPFEIQVPEGDSCQIALHATGSERVLKRSIAADELPAELDLRIHMGTLQLDTEGLPVLGASRKAVTVEWERDGWHMQLRLQSGKSGDFAPEVIPAGDVTLLWRLPGQAESLRREVRIAAEGVTTVSL